MAWTIKVSKKAAKMMRNLPLKERALAEALMNDIRLFGPVQGTWHNYSKLTHGHHHCHLSHRYVAVWIETDKGIEVEVTYVGSRENAPY